MTCQASGSCERAMWGGRIADRRGAGARDRLASYAVRPRFPRNDPRRVRMFLDIVLVVLGITCAQEPAPAPASAPAAVVAEPPTIACPRCLGKRVALETCLACGGAGAANCTACSLEAAPVPRYPFSEKLTAADFTRLKELLRTLDVAQQLRAKVLNGAGRGRLSCPEQCQQIAHPRNGYPCRLCDGKGNLECVPCAGKGTRACPSCAGKRQVLRACEACLGSNVVFDPASIATEQRTVCPWCHDKSRACTECKNGKVELPCASCLGDKTLACTTCLGTKHARCGACNSTGSSKPKAEAKVRSDCSKCRGKGMRDCDACKRTGKETCDECKGKGRVTANCRACLGDKVRPCGGCFLGSYSAWEFTAGLRESAGDRAGAAEWLAIAKQRAEKFYAFQLREIALGAAEERELGSERDRELERLAKRIESLSAPAPR